jgi:hypothetical protein
LYSAKKSPRQLRRGHQARPHGKEYVIIEEDGLPVAALMDVDEFEDYLELHDPEVNRVIAQSRREYLAAKSRPAEELLRELEEEEAREREPERTTR